MTKRLLIVSNRLPITIIKKGSEYSTQDSVGGLATGLGSIYNKRDSLWIGWPGIILDTITRTDTEKISKILKKKQCNPVFLTEYEYEHYYNELCNKAIWPLFHNFYEYAQYNFSDWKTYVQVNQKFCDTVCSVAMPEDIIWVHDYQLMLLPAMIRDRIPDATIGFFLHIPFPPYELFRMIPRSKELLAGLVGADLIGFHTSEYLQYFLNNIRRILGYEHEMMEIKTENRVVKVDIFPMGIDFQKFKNSVKSPQVKREMKRIRDEIPKGKIILSIDRLDYIKGIPLRLKAFEILLEDHEELRGKVTLILVVVPSRTQIDQYTQLRHEVDHLVGKINGIFGDISWTPVRYMYNFIPFNQLIANYSIADLALITPLRDGMNLIAKEYLATKSNGSGMLILSEFAGAAQELGEAILINPNDIKEFSGAIYVGLMLSEVDKQKRITIMQKRLQRHDLNRWTSDFIEALDKVKRFQNSLSATWMDERSISQLCCSYNNACSRIFFLDYDGTLFPLVKTPDMARPDKEIITLLEDLSRDPRNDVVIASGRERKVLDSWFGQLPIGLISEHGIWTKEKGKEWEMDTSVSNEWKDELIPILEIYMDRTPGSFVEEKEYSLAWHFRNADPDLAIVRAREIREDLILRTKNLNLNLLEGHKVLEIKNADINKGIGVLKWLQKSSYDFCFAAGDDRTDEDIFSVLNQGAYTIKVGSTPSGAVYCVQSVDEIRGLLRCLLS